MTTTTAATALPRAATARLPAATTTAGAATAGTARLRAGTGRLLAVTRGTTIRAGRGLLAGMTTGGTIASVSHTGEIATETEAGQSLYLPFPLLPHPFSLVRGEWTEQDADTALSCPQVLLSVRPTAARRRRLVASAASRSTGFRKPGGPPSPVCSLEWKWICFASLLWTTTNDCGDASASVQARLTQKGQDLPGPDTVRRHTTWGVVYNSDRGLIMASAMRPSTASWRHSHLRPHHRRRRQSSVDAYPASSAVHLRLRLQHRLRPPVAASLLGRCERRALSCTGGWTISDTDGEGKCSRPTSRYLAR